jgi:hypothetical protein
VRQQVARPDNLMVKAGVPWNYEELRDMVKMELVFLQDELFLEGIL